MEKRNTGTRLYNIMLPLWLLVFIPSWLWLALIPLNYLIDRIVLRWSLGDMPEKGLFCRRHTWKICVAGFTSDFIGAMFMLGVFFIGALINDESPLFDDIVGGVGFNPFTHWLAFVIVAVAVAVAGLFIYLLDRWILKKAGLSLEQAKKSALRLAVFTGVHHAHDLAAGGLRLCRNNGDLLSEQAVEQRRLAHVGLADNRDKSRFCIAYFFQNLQLRIIIWFPYILYHINDTMKTVL